MDRAKQDEMRRNLKEQKKMKRMAQRQEAQEAKIEAEIMSKQISAVMERETQDFINARSKSIELQQHWKLQHAMRKERPEWDLTDPKNQKTGSATLPAEQLGVSSMQVFKGIEPGHGAAFETQRKMENQRQAEFNAAKRHQEKIENQRETAQLQAAADYASTLAGEEYAASRAAAYRLMQENKAMTRAKHEMQRNAKAQEDELSKLEIKMTLSQLNEEERKQTNSNGRVARVDFKGFPKESLAEMESTNLQRMEQCKARRQAEISNDNHHALMRRHSTEYAKEQATIQFIEKKHAEMKLAQEVRYQAREAKQQKAAQRKAIQNNAVEASFFERFGK